MKTKLLTCVLCIPVLVGACGSVPADSFSANAVPQTLKARKHEASSHQIAISDAAGTVTVQKIEFRSGISSTTVERLARNAGCNGNQGAGLMTEKGPVEVYRMQCDNGNVYIARCELRQCWSMR